MRSALSFRPSSLTLVALVLIGASCTKDKGTGLLTLNITADSAIVPAPANKIVISDPRGSIRTWVGLFPRADASAFVLQIPDLPASDSPVLFSVQAFDSGGCPISDVAKVSATIKAGSSTPATAVKLLKGLATCGDGGTPGAPTDGGGVFADGAGDLDAKLPLGVDAATDDADRDVLQSISVEAGRYLDADKATDAVWVDSADAQLILDTSVDVPMGGGDVRGAGGASGSGGIGGIDASGAGGAGGSNVTDAPIGSGGTLGSGGTSGTGGIPGSGGATSTGGIIGSGGTTGTGGTPGTGGATSTCPGAASNMISDFESGVGDMLQQGGRTGYWYVFFPGSDTSSTPASGMSQTPLLVNGGPIAIAASTDTGTCDKYALHTTGSGFGGTINNYAGFGATFLPHVPYDKASNAYDVSAYTGISFKMKSGSGTPPAVFFEVLTKENQPSALGGTATNMKIDLYNTRGQMLYIPWTANAISSSWQTITVPFGTLIPRWLPDSSGCGTAPSTPKCQAKPLVPTDVLGIQFSMYRDNGFPTPVGSTAGTYDLWIDDVAFTTDDSGLQPRPGFPLTSPGSMGTCLSPQGPSAAAKYLVPAYNQWKANFVSGNRVIRPQNANDTTSEGIAFGMLIAVNMNDQTLFDGLSTIWKSYATAGSLMSWCVTGGGGGTGSSCSSSGGSSTGADEDAAFALLQADKLWPGGTYKTSALTMISDIWLKDIDSGTLLPKGGSNYGAPTGTSGTGITSASYFAPAYYKAFKAAGDTNNWDGVVTAIYRAIGTIAGSNGLIPAWCGSSCTVAASNGASTDLDYQYDSHRIPMRLGLDYCFNGQAEAKTYTTKTTAFFATAATNGTGYVLDMYTPSGAGVSGSAPISASILGTAAVGAMASGNQTFLNDAFQVVFDEITRGTLNPVDASGKSPYSYYNATVGLLTALIMTGNFMH